jgi:hypothetical protein
MAKPPKKLFGGGDEKDGEGEIIWLNFDRK